MPLSLPDTFAFSQSSLQAYEHCRRRFWLTYVQQLPWPAVEAAPVEEHERQLLLGAQFHRLVQRAEAGMDPELLAAHLEDPLDGWFDAYRRHRPADLPAAAVEIEQVLSVPFGAYRLAAKYDLIAVRPDGRSVIVDWKTNQRPTPRAILQQRLQSVVYPFVLVEASAALPWGPVEPEQVEMRYWFTAAPDAAEILHYSAGQHAANHTRLQRLLAEILAGNSEVDFPKVPDSESNRRRFCQYCVYRSHCDRGVSAGPLDELGDMEEPAADAGEFFAVEPSTSLEFTLDEVEELAF